MTYQDYQKNRDEFNKLLEQIPAYLLIYKAKEKIDSVYTGDVYAISDLVYDIGFNKVIIKSPDGDVASVWDGSDDYEEYSNIITEVLYTDEDDEGYPVVFVKVI